MNIEEMEGGTYFLDTETVKVRKHYGVQALYIKAKTQQEAFSTLSAFIGEYGFHVGTVNVKYEHYDKEYPVRLLVFN